MARVELTERQGRIFSIVALAERDGLMHFGLEGTFIQLTDAGVAWCEERGLTGRGRGYSHESDEGLHQFLLAYARELGFPV